MAPLFSWSLPLLLRSARASELAELRRELQADHARLAVNLRAGCEQLKTLEQWVDGASVEHLLIAYKALIAIVEREDFTSMRTERIPVVIAQVTARLARLGRMLRASQAGTCGDAMRLH